MEPIKLLPFFIGYLNTKLLSTDRSLHLERRQQEELFASLAEGESTYLVLDDGRSKEIVLVTNSCDQLLLERGQDGTTPKTFACGAAASFEMVPAVIRYMICTETCVECECSPVSFSGSVTPEIVVGQSWEGSAIFSGDTPMALAVQGAPSWMEVIVGVNYIRMSGVPTSAGPVTLSVAASNCGGEVDTTTIEIK